MNIKSQEVSEKEGIPVLVKHLPDWENARNRASYILNADDLQNALGARPVLSLIDFTGGTEAVTAPYPQGKLLIVEFTTPQGSVDADNKIKQSLAQTWTNFADFLPPHRKLQCVYFRRLRRNGGERFARSS